MRTKRTKFLLFLVLAPLVGLKALGLQVVTESLTLGPEKIRIVRKEGLQLYKDPNLWDWQELEMDPRLTCLTGEVTIQRLYTQPLSNFRYVSKVYESKLSDLLRAELKSDSLRAKPKAEVRFGQEHEKGFGLGPMAAVFIEILDGAYRGTFGFVVADDLKKAQTQEQTSNRLPPSVDSIPQWKATKAKRNNNFPFGHRILEPSLHAPQSQNAQHTVEVCLGFCSIVACKSDPNLRAEM